MQARILPMPQNSTAKWSNWMSYLDRIESEIKSLQSYLDYFNPDNTLVHIEPEERADNEFYYNLNTLKFREYIQINKENAYIEFKNGNKTEKKSVPIAYTVRCMKNDPESINDFQLLSGSAISLYYIDQDPAGLLFSYLTPEDGVLGTSFSFNIAGFASRYIYKGGLNHFNPQSVQWSSIASAYNSTSASADLLIADKQNLVWDGLYPLMHKLEVHYKDNQDDVYEDFIADDTFKVDKTNIANHTTMRYTINVKNINNDNINKVDLSWVAINII